MHRTKRQALRTAYVGKTLSCVPAICSNCVTRTLSMNSVGLAHSEIFCPQAEVNATRFHDWRCVLRLRITCARDRRECNALQMRIAWYERYAEKVIAGHESIPKVREVYYVYICA